LLLHLRGGLVAVVNSKGTRAFYFPSGFAIVCFHFVPFPLARFNFNCTPASSCVFSLFSPGEQSRSKERPKERPRLNGQPRAETAAAVAATVAAACRPKPGAGIQQGAPLLISFAFTGAAKVPGVHVHVKHI
jgi:hypothetical protein